MTYKGSDPVEARIEWLDEEGQSVRLIWPDEAPTTWYRCEDQTEPVAEEGTANEAATVPTN